MPRSAVDGAKAGKRCPNCSYEARPQDVYCENCGTRLEERYEIANKAGEARSLERENLELRRKLWKLRRAPSRVSGLSLSSLGFASLAASVLYESSILAFIGLGLSFWGALLLFARPSHYVRSEVLESGIRAHYLSLQRLLDHLGYEGRPVYVPPRRLEDVKGGSVFIAAEGVKNEEGAFPPDFSTRDFITPNPHGVNVVPPGLGIANLLEEEMGRNFSSMDLGYLAQNLPAALVEGFEFAEGVEIEEAGGSVAVKIRNSIFEFFYREGMDKRLGGIGCPLVSSIALALARATGQPVVVSDAKLDPESGTVSALYEFLGGASP
ncbi:MAG: hypothetical protein JTT11_09310 [Candidatus Brockarchaeota archaeon]|nr:hypothetical protein [Candidatus Brockarchaeota archaeon]